MKIINEPIKVMAVFHTNGKIEPVKFRLDDKVVRIERIMKDFRKEAIEEIGEMKLESKVDYLLDDTGMPETNALRYFLDDESWYAIRPSGTEPKIKLYMYSKDKVEEKAEKKIEGIKDIVLKRIESIK